MFNRGSFKNIILPALGLILIGILSFFIILNIQYKNYEKTINIVVANILEEVIIKYPDTDEEEIIKILNNKDFENSLIKNKTAIKLLENYGYTNNIPYIQKLEETMSKALKVDILFICLYGLIIVIILLVQNKKHNKKIQEISKYLNEVNNGNYELKIEDNREDELSRLRNELYKTTILLKEVAANNEKERINLSNSLADISHQLKTPLTSIRIMLDNIEENPNMDSKTRSEFMKEISRQIDWISSLVISLLKLAKFDAGAIVMKDAHVNVKKLIDNVLANLAIMLDVKNIKVVKNINDNVYIEADYNWQLEAFTNIVKNAIEHSNQDSTIYINVESNSIFVRISITDEGEGIRKEDIKHIFKRFYKAKKSSDNSIGIGLSLAKTIIEKDNGTIKVNSQIGKGTTFEIEYLKQ